MQRFSVTRLVLTGGSAPTEWEGWTSLNRQIYIRYREGELSIKLGPVGDNSMHAAESRGETIFRKKVGEDWDAALTYRELIRTVKAIDWPKNEPERALRQSLL